MNKKFIWTVVLCTVTMSLMAQPVSRLQAQEKAKTFMQGKECSFNAAQSRQRAQQEQ